MAKMLTDKSEVLFRQIHPEKWDNGQPSSEEFRPYKKDNGQLSVDRSEIITAEGSFGLFTRNGYSSSAVFGVTVGEFGAESIGHLEKRLEADPVLIESG